MYNMYRYVTSYSFTEKRSLGHIAPIAVLDFFAKAEVMGQLIFRFLRHRSFFHQYHLLRLIGQL